MSFDTEQREAVRRAFEEAGFVGGLATLPVTSESERVFILHEQDYFALTTDVVDLERVLQAVIGRKVFIEVSVDDTTVPFK